MLSWKALSLVVAAAVAMNGVVGLEQGYGGGIWTTAPPTSTESSSDDQQSSSEESSQSTDDSTGSDVDIGSQVDGSSTSDEGSDAYPGTTPSPDSSYGNSLSWDGSGVSGSSGSFPGGKITSGDGSSVYIEVPSASEDGVPSPSDVSSGSVDVPPGKGGIYSPSSASGSDRTGEASTGGDGDQNPPTGGCQVRTRRLRQ
ncbi:hypothetical protein PHYPSEUDO_014898 [Phytophthora pseudosyringae]|uniref:Uncharacterized protein n=1 Tax=Phytophthora pseudosyringae TaxID=221518 RepID=A0A8T1V743_9STRA|nr:hypothetical protein PHYPSEUDO_014898 [Phytophthora pseudosyringae]